MTTFKGPKDEAKQKKEENFNNNTIKIIYDFVCKQINPSTVIPSHHKLTQMLKFVFLRYWFSISLLPWLNTYRIGSVWLNNMCVWRCSNYLNWYTLKFLTSNLSDMVHISPYCVCSSVLHWNCPLLSLTHHQTERGDSTREDTIKPTHFNTAASLFELTQQHLDEEFKQKLYLLIN